MNSTNTTTPAVRGTCKQFVGMTATLINGYSSGIFHLLYRIVPGLMRKDGKGYRQPSDFDAEYGVVENTYEVTDGDYNSNRRTTKRKSKSRQLPGVSPLVFSRFLLEYTAFLSLCRIWGRTCRTMRRFRFR